MVKDMDEVLHGMRRRETIANVFKFIYLVIIIASLGGVYYFISPLIEPIVNGESRAQELFKRFGDLRSQIPETGQLDNALQQLKDVTSSTLSK